MLSFLTLYRRFPPTSYTHLFSVLYMRIGSINNARKKCLERVFFTLTLLYSISLREGEPIRSTHEQNVSLALFMLHSSRSILLLSQLALFIRGASRFWLRCQPLRASGADGFHSRVPVACLLRTQRTPCQNHLW